MCRHAYQHSCCPTIATEWGYHTHRGKLLSNPGQWHLAIIPPYLPGSCKEYDSIETLKTARWFRWWVENIFSPIFLQNLKQKYLVFLFFAVLLLIYILVLGKNWTQPTITTKFTTIKQFYISVPETDVTVFFVVIFILVVFIVVVAVFVVAKSNPWIFWHTPHPSHF